MLIYFIGLDNNCYCFGDDKNMMFKNPKRNVYEVILDDNKIPVSKDVWDYITERRSWI